MRTLPTIREMIARLVAMPSVSSMDVALDQPNLPVVQRLAEWAEALGFAVEVLDVPGHPGKHNLVARLGSGDGGLVLAGHTDTVPWDEGAWRTAPFEVVERDGNLHGLGTADMKSFLALALEAASAVRADALREPLVLLATADEESGMFGARALLDAGTPLGRRAIIGEPTSLVPIRMHKGVQMESLRLVGRSGHSSNPALGASALEGMRTALEEIARFRAELQAAHREPAFDVAVPTLNLGVLRAGDAPNRICARAELQLDLRLLPGMDIEAEEARLRDRLTDALAGSGLSLELAPMFEPVPPFETPADSELVRAAEEMTGERARAVAFGTEAPFLARMGVETIVMGPGSIDVAHQPDEHLPLDSLEPTVELLRRMVHRFCIEGDR